MNSDRESKMLRVLTQTSRQFYVCFAILCAVALWGLLGYVKQLREGLGVTGLSDEVSWGLYISNFVFFTGISYGGTLISAILRVTNSAWRHPITRLSEAITVFALCIGGPMVIIDMGRPERMMFLFTHGRLQSVILWDVIAVSTYLAGCALYLYLPMIPDLALLSNHSGIASWRRKLYRKLTFGWTGTPAEQKLLERCISGMAVFMIVLAVSVHTVVSWIFGMTLRPGWNSSIFGPYFVMGAVYSGTAAVVLSMYILARVLHLEDYIKPVHFRNLGILLVTFSLLYLYFNINEYLTAGYKVEGPEKHLMQQLFFGDYAVMMWMTQALLIFIPLAAITAALCVKLFQKYIPIIVAGASLLIIVGAGAKRYLIVVPTLTTPFLPDTTLTHYRPTWVEWSITFGGVAVFLLMYMLFTKVFPMISIWETRHDEVPAERVPATAPTPKSSSRSWKTLSGVSTILAAFLLMASSDVWAEQKPPAKQPEPTTLSLEYKQVAALVVNTEQVKQTQTPKVGQLATRVDQFIGRLLGWTSSDYGEESEIRPAMQITANLRDSKGQPLAYQVLSLSLKTSFGILDFGSRPTDEDGHATFLVKDKRYGQYPIECTYEGGTDFAAAKATASVDFGPRPEPSLPAEGVLIGPKSAAVIAIPVLGFFGFSWFVFLFVGVYILFWRLPQIRKRGLKKMSLSQVKLRSSFSSATGIQGRKPAGSNYRIL